MRTIWSKNGLPLVPEAYKGLYRYVFPITDALGLFFAISSLTAGSQSVNASVTPWFSIAWACVLLGGTSVALWSIIFRLDRAEVWGRLAIGLGLLIYAAASIIHVTTDNPSALLPLSLTFGRLTLTVWRINDLASHIAETESRGDRGTNG